MIRLLFISLLLLTSCKSKLQEGDSITYKYSGAYRENPVILKELITNKDGNELTIDVQLISKGVKRHWIQIVTDTPENKASNKVDKLFFLDGNTKKLLPNKNNSDLYKLYEGTYIIPSSKPRNVKAYSEQRLVCGKMINVSIHESDQIVKNKLMRFQSVQSDEFIWNHVGASYKVKESGKIYYQVEIVKCG